MNDKPRLIDANALKKELDAWASPIRNRKFYVRDDAICVIDAAPTVDAVPQWIPVTERLPEVYRDKYGELIPFLVCLKDTDYPFRAFFDGEKWGDGCSKLSVVAWMPLPEPYRKENKNEQK